jgi:hypothetical protein
MNVGSVPPRMASGARFLVVLDTMWGETGDAPRWFAINPVNHSGRRLYRLTGAKFGELWVTNVCQEQVDRPSGRGTPSPEWLRASLDLLPARLALVPLLVCGRRVVPVYRACGYEHLGPVHETKHPAARDWTAAEIAAVTNTILNGGK